MSTSLKPRRRLAFALVATPAVVIFLSSNVVNFGNLAFNMIFSRLMGPELFGTLAFLLTIKLALLGIMGAFQMAVSQMVASSTGDERPGVEQALSRINRFLFLGTLFLGITLTTGILLGEAVGARLLTPELHLLVLLFAGIPFGASMSLLRGIAFADMQTSRIVVSANAEMGVRLVGALLAWWLGFGIEGVIVAISLSIVAGWLVLADLLPGAPVGHMRKGYAKPLAMASVPFALLQVTQVTALDGEIFLAKFFLSEEDAGFTAALSLFQRIQFFACFALASVLLPRVISAAQANENVLHAALPVFALFAVVSLTVISASLIAPDLLISLLVGDAYKPASSALLGAVIAAVFFTFNYLATTLLIAVKNKIGIAVVVAGTLMQIFLMLISNPQSFEDLIAIKAFCQPAIAILLCICVARQLRRLAKNAPFVTSL